ncbi:MAG: hypothetical protein ACYSU0_22820, partial [Planctomycetota bacterium]
MLEPDGREPFDAYFARVRESIETGKPLAPPPVTSSASRDAPDAKGAAPGPSAGGGQAEPPPRPGRKEEMLASYKKTLVASIAEAIKDGRRPTYYSS